MKRNGFTLAELTIGAALMATVLFGSMGVLISSLRSFQRTDNDVTLSEQNAGGLRRVGENIRSAMAVTLQNSGTSIVYNLPTRSSTNDAVTGEKEYSIPLTSDGVNREYKVLNGELIDVNNSNRVLVKNISTTDPDPNSSQYNQTYAPFQMTTIGSRRAITINLITYKTVSGMKSWSRLKTTVLIENAR